MKLRQFIHSYSGYNGADSECRFSVYESAGGCKIVVADELPTNTGTPIREFSEHLATQAYRQLFSPSAAHIDEFLYIEHAPTSPDAVEYAYEMVEFDWQTEGDFFIRPRRMRLTDEEVLELVGGEM